MIPVGSTRVKQGRNDDPHVMLLHQLFFGNSLLHPQDTVVSFFLDLSFDSCLQRLLQ